MKYALSILVSFVLGSGIMLNGIYLYFKWDNSWVMMKREDVGSMYKYIDQLQKEIHKHGWDEMHKA